MEEFATVLIVLGTENKSRDLKINENEETENN
jgi:hypothetical protein